MNKEKLRAYLQITDKSTKLKSELLPIENIVFRYNDYFEFEDGNILDYEEFLCFVNDYKYKIVIKEEN